MTGQSARVWRYMIVRLYAALVLNEDVSISEAPDVLHCSTAALKDFLTENGEILLRDFSEAAWMTKKWSYIELLVVACLSSSLVVYICLFHDFNVC